MRFNPDGSEKPDFVLNKPGLSQGQDPGGGRQFRLRLKPRARSLGAAGFRHPLRHRAQLRRHLLWQLLQGTASCRSSLPQSDVDKLRDDDERGTNAVISLDLEKQEITGSRWLVGQVRGRSLPQAVPADMAGRYRPTMRTEDKIASFEQLAAPSATLDLEASA
jgi:3-isopropylmalate/(R)-2-methylmalate dehydratase small subunit